MKRILSLLYIVFLFIAIAPRVFAHELKISGGISVLFHISPDHDPVIGKPAFLDFRVTDRNKKFNGNACDCSLQIKDGQQILYSEPIKQTAESYGTFVFNSSFVFPKKSLYTVIFTGKPSHPGDFSAFKVEYLQRVERENMSPDFAAAPTVSVASAPNTTHEYFSYIENVFVYNVAILAISSILVIIFWKKIKKKKIV